MSLFSFLGRRKSDPTVSGNGFRSRTDPGSSTSRAAAADRKAARRDPVDPALPEKKRARRRLVGAIALVLALVIGLPMILDSEPKPMSGDIAIQIPSKTSNLPPVTKPANEAATTAANAVPSTDESLAGLDAREEVVQPDTSIKSALSGSTPSVGKVEPTPVPLVAPAPAITKAKPVVTPEVEAPIKTAQTEHAKTEHPKVGKAEKPEKSAGTPHKEITPKQDDAARAQAILEGRMPPKTSTVGTPVTAKDGKFVLQVAALASADKVAELRGKLSDAGIQSYTQTVKTASGPRTRVRVGPFGSKSEAEKVRAQLGKLGLNGALVPA